MSGQVVQYLLHGGIVDDFRQGGIFMYPLLLFSLLAVTVIVERSIIFRRARVDVSELLTRVRKALLVDHDIKGAVQICEKHRAPVAAVLKAALLRHGRSREEVEKTIENAGLYELDRLENRLGILATTSNVAPMLGFLGTVTGMIKSFGSLATQGLNNPSAVAAGISEALITTAAGLIIAIPAQLAYNWFTTRINRFVRDVETGSNMLLETFGEMRGSERTSV